MSISYQSPGIFEETRFEKIHNIIFDSAKEASIEVAHEIAELIRKKTRKGEDLCAWFSNWFFTNFSLSRTR
jgi:glucosamine-6-phosphate deaminase